MDLIDYEGYAGLNGLPLIHIHKQMSLAFNKILKLWDTP
jgi:hypothetical protein